MSASPATMDAKQSPAPDSESSGGFRSFWKNTNKDGGQGGVTFVPQDPSTKGKGNKITRLFKQGTGSQGSEGSPSGGSGKSGVQKRRQQVYQAQKRHRNRKSEYIKSLEAEVARLQHLDSVVHNEKNMLARQNKAIRDFLASQSIDVQLDSVNLAGANTAKDDLNTLGGATVDIRYDSDLGHDRTFLDLADFSSDMVWTSESSVGDETLSGLPVSQSPVQGNSRAALDFILALEWPCKDHISHAGINPGVEVPVPTDPEHVHGHALTTTAAVFQSALPPWNTNGEDTPQHLSVPNPGQNGHQASPGKWLLPHAEIDKLVTLSEQLPLDDELMTPAQAYSAIRQHVRSIEDLKHTLDYLKVPLGTVVQCQGFGAALPTTTFWQHLESVLQAQ